MIVLMRRAIHFKSKNSTAKQTALEIVTHSLAWKETKILARFTWIPSIWPECRQKFVDNRTKYTEFKFRPFFRQQDYREISHTTHIHEKKKSFAPKKVDRNQIRCDCLLVRPQNKTVSHKRTPKIYQSRLVLILSSQFCS